jgi:hypothetical protein
LRALDWKMLILYGRLVHFVCIFPVLVSFSKKSLATLVFINPRWNNIDEAKGTYTTCRYLRVIEPAKKVFYVFRKWQKCQKSFLLRLSKANHGWMHSVTNCRMIEKVNYIGRKKVSKTSPQKTFAFYLSAIKTFNNNFRY